MDHVRKVPLPENVYRILHSRRSDVNDLFIRRFQCTAEVNGPSIAAGSASLKVYEKRLLGGTLVSVWRDDLTRQDTDVVVNAANEHLEHWAGLACALVKAGGEQIVQESRDWIYRHGALRAGDIAVTTAGALPSKRIVHAVGPRWSAGIAKMCMDQLNKAIRNVLDYVGDQTDLHSVAIPAVSSGIFGFPLDLCAEIIVSTVNTFCYTKGKGHLKEVRLVNYDDKTVQAMKTACEKILGSSDTASGAASYSAAAAAAPPSYSTAAPPYNSYSAPASSSYSAAASPYNSTAAPPYNSYSAPASYSYSAAASSSYSAAASPYNSYSAPASYSYSAPASSSYSAQLMHQEVSLSVNGLNLHLKTGCIEDEKTEVIVNSVAPELILDSGVISRAIYSKAGREMQEEIWRKCQWKQIPTMISTRGYNLPCKYVYHVILQGSQDQAAILLREVTRECLKKAHQHRSPSVSFPALGTGNIGLRKDRVADIMTQCVLDFARENQRNMNVYFVIHPKDTDTLKAFQDKFRKTGLMSDNKMAEPTERGRAPEPPGEGTYVTLSGESRGAVDEAEAWLLGVLSSPPVIIHNNLLLLFGSEEFDVLASGPSGADITEDLSNGRVTLKISGPQPDKAMAAIQAERLLLDVQEKMAESLEEELLEAAVVWFYESPSGSHKYSAKATRELEKAFASGTNVTLSATPGHVIDIRNLTAQEGGQRLSIRRLCLRSSIQTEKWLPQIEPVKSDGQELRDRRTEFKRAGLELVKMEKVQNKLLAGVFQTKKEAAEKKQKESVEKRQKKPSTEQMYQLVSRQFLKNICAAGFHRLYVTPADSKYGVGVYFKKSLHNITQRFHVPKEKEELLYILQAEVVTGAATNYSRYQPVLPCQGPDALQVYESVIVGGLPAEHYAIFDRFQANPQYVFTCRKI